MRPVRIYGNKKVSLCRGNCLGIVRPEVSSFCDEPKTICWFTDVVIDLLLSSFVIIIVIIIIFVVVTIVILIVIIDIIFIMIPVVVVVAEVVIVVVGVVVSGGVVSDTCARITAPLSGWPLRAAAGSKGRPGSSSVDNDLSTHGPSPLTDCALKR